MIKNKVSFEIEKNERKYVLLMDSESPLGELFDIICMMKNEIINRIRQEEEKKTENVEI